MRILVTGLGGMAGGNVTKLMPQGSVVIACDANPAARSELSRLGVEGVRFFTVPRAGNKDAFKMALNQMVVRYNIDTVIPTVDEELMVLSYRPEHIDARVVVSPYVTVRACLDKERLYQAVQGEPFCPRFVVTDDRQDLSIFSSEPVFMKPRVGRGSRGTRLFSSTDEIPGEMVSRDNVFCEHLPGTEYTVDCLFDLDGTMVAMVPRKRLEVLHGKSARGETHRHPGIGESVKKLSSILKFTGPVNMQFKQDPMGRMRLVEVNPRFSGGLPITAEAGANLPELLHRMLSGERADPPAWREGVFENPLIQKQRISRRGDMA